MSIIDEGEGKWAEKKLCFQRPLSSQAGSSGVGGVFRCATVPILGGNQGWGPSGVLRVLVGQREDAASRLAGRASVAPPAFRSSLAALSSCRAC